MYQATKLKQTSRSYSVPNRRPLHLSFFSARQLDQIPQIVKLPHDMRFAMKVVAQVLKVLKTSIYGPWPIVYAQNSIPILPVSRS